MKKGHGLMEATVNYNGFDHCVSLMVSPFSGLTFIVRGWISTVKCTDFKLWEQECELALYQYYNRKQ